MAETKVKSYTTQVDLDLAKSIEALFYTSEQYEGLLLKTVQKGFPPGTAEYKALFDASQEVYQKLREGYAALEECYKPAELQGKASRWEFTSFKDGIVTWYEA